MDTPHTEYLSEKDYEKVYKPAEDSFLLLDAVEDDLVYIKKLQPVVCLEIGSGTGIIITAISKKFNKALCLATDINPYACCITKQTSKNNQGSIDVINTNLVKNIRNNVVDLLVFNPPYVVTNDEELEQSSNRDFKSVTEKNLVYSWAGGHNGRRVIDNLINCLDSILSPKGVLYLLVLRENKPNEIIEKLNAMQFKAVQFKERRVPGEYLYVLKIVRS